MPTPSSPARSHSSHSASSASTPSSQRVKSPIELTPRSKVKALLAGFDDGSDEEESRPIAPKERVDTLSSVPENTVPKVFTVVSDDDSDDDDVPVAPRGRLAGRMLASDSAGQDGGDAETGGTGAYERIKKQLLARQKANQEAEARELNQTASEKQDESASENDADFRSATPQRRIPSTKLSSRASSHRSQPESPTKSASDSDADMSDSIFNKSRLAELVARKRAERKAAEDEEKRKRADARRHRKEVEEMMKSGGTAETDSDEGDAEARKKLTQQARPTRKASKKAMEEMNRETQRMSRNMQLAHQAKTKKRYSTADLFKKMGFRQDAENQLPPVVQGSSDVEVGKEADTPPTSPMACDDEEPKTTGVAADSSIEEGVQSIVTANHDDDLPSLENILSQTAKQEEKGKGKAPAHSGKTILNLGTFGSKAPKPKVFRIRPSVNSTGPAPQEIDLSSEDELNVQPTAKASRLPVFDRIPAKKASEPSSLLILRALAHLTSPGKKQPKNAQVSLAPSELHTMLQRRARQQAASEKSERIAELRAKGIFIQTDEEREKEQLELENLLERARKEALELGKKEKEARKNATNGEEGGDQDRLMDDSSDDEEYVASEDEEDGGVELSGSEDEDEEDVEEQENEDGVQGTFLDNEASESDEEEDAISELGEVEEAAEVVQNAESRAFRKKRVIMDEDDEQEDSEVNTSTITADADQSIEDAQTEAAAAFGFAPTKGPSLGLTQMFAGSMAESQSQQNSIFPNVDAEEEDSLDFLRQIPVSTVPDFGDQLMEISQNLLVRDSQLALDARDSQQIELGITQLPSQMPEATQISDFAPTQDDGFQISRTPARSATAPHSTVDTVVLPIPESPVVTKKKGRLVRRSEAAAVLSDIDEQDAEPAPQEEDDEFEITSNAFDVLRTGAKKKNKELVEFDKKKSDAKGMVQEQAEESEDEYAGLGGASDDESNDEMDEEMKEMIDEGEVNINESKIAALFADKERADDEKRIDKLYKDLTTGALRRKRGADLDDLSDSDDEAEERRRRKQRDFAKMRKALLDDENIGKIATNPKKQAFLRAIEDRDEEEDSVDYLHEIAEDEHPVSAESQSQQPAESQVIESTEPAIVSTQNLKRKNGDIENTENIPPFKHPRRTGYQDTAPKKARTLEEIRESVSFLIEEPSMFPESQYSDLDSDTEDPLPFRREHLAIVDRLSAKRSLAASTSSDSSNNLAFLSSEKSSAPGFKVPSLLRRSTTSSTISTSSSSSASTLSSTKNVRAGGSKKSSIHAQAREAERRAVVEAAEKRKREEVRRNAVGAGRRSVLGVLRGRGNGGFE